MNKTRTATNGRARRERADSLEFTTGDKRLRVDREKGIIYGVKIIGNESRNNRTYPQAVLSKARRQYERRSVNVSHPSREKAADDRPFESFFGRLENVREEDGLRGDLHYIKSHPLAEVVCEAAERMPENFGLSHNAHVDWLVRDDGLRVCESINTVRSVDLVCRPATTNGIFESQSKSEQPYMDGSEPGGGNGIAAKVEPESPATVKQMFLDAAARIFDEDDADPADKASRIAQLARTLLQVEDDVEAAVNGEDADQDNDEDGTESVQEKVGKQAAELADAKKRLAAFERRERARDALEAARVEATKARITAVAALESEGDRKALIDEFKGIRPAGPQAGKTKPKSVPATTLESQGPERATLPTGLKPRTKEDLKNLASSLQRR
ncbi:MAG TPA: hypothetical protein VG826_31070 [Pirellulales bacterium]|nr:hypothetical protein [Pirellulales bacterium]